MTERPTIVAVGELLAEFIAVDEAGRALDASREAPRLFAGPFASGAPAIAIDQAARCGADAAMIGAVGEDAFGRAILARLGAAGVRLEGVRIDPERPTGTAHVAYRGDGSREFVFHIAGSAAEHAALPGGACSQGGILMVSGSTLGVPTLRECVMDAAERMRAAGGGLAVDPNVRPELTAAPAVRSALETLLRGASLATPSEEDLAALFPGRSAEDGAAALLALGAGVVAVTRGAKGASVFCAGERFDLAGHAVEVVDPTGAGDAFTATLATLHARGMPLSEAARFANAAGALAVTRLGPMEGNTDLAALARFLENA